MVNWPGDSRLIGRAMVDVWSLPDRVQHPIIISEPRPLTLRGTWGVWGVDRRLTDGRGLLAGSYY